MESLFVPATLVVAYFIFVKLIYFDPRKEARDTRAALERDGRLPMRRLRRLSASRRGKLYHELIRRLLLDDQYGVAEEVIALLLEIDEKGALNWQIDLALHAGNNEALVDLCRQALAYHEENVELRTTLVQSLLALDRVDEALEEGEWAEENRDPDLLRAYGDALEAAGESESAANAYQEAERVEAERARARLALEQGFGA